MFVWVPVVFVAPTPLVPVEFDGPVVFVVPVEFCPLPEPWFVPPPAPPNGPPGTVNVTVCGLPTGAPLELKAWTVY